ncbi:MAG TPA: hypothetical protein VMI52_12050 [Acetobacteraceae bacterium]|nr:hypothetical protein [Acetobacteraceae bacterium]
MTTLHASVFTLDPGGCLGLWVRHGIAFAGRVWRGISRAGISSADQTARFHEGWAKLAGGYDALGKKARLSMVPGMDRRRGTGPNVFDAPGALARWGNRGVATKSTDDNPPRGRPCAA